MTAFTSKLSQMNFSSVICKSALTGLPSPAVWQLPLPCIRSACTWIQSLSPRLTGSQPSCWLLLSGCLQLCYSSTVLVSSPHVGLKTALTRGHGQSGPFGWHSSAATLLQGICLSPSCPHVGAHTATGVTRGGPRALHPLVMEPCMSSYHLMRS